MRTKESIFWMRSCTLVKVPRRMARWVMRPNQRSTWLSRLMLGSASAQTNVTCTVSGELNLGTLKNSVICYDHGTPLWLAQDKDSTTIYIIYGPWNDYHEVALAQNSTTTVCESAGNPCVQVQQGTISDNQLPVTLTGYSN